MMPIVHGLEEEFGDSMAFLYFNAGDGGEGQRTFEALTLPGHPSVLIFLPDGREIYRAFGILSEETMRTAVTNALSSPVTTNSP